MKRDALRDTLASGGAAVPGGGAARAGLTAGTGTGPEFKAQVAFHLTGHRAGGDLEALDSPRLRPALLAGYRDLTRLRYDFPLVLADPRARGDWVRSLSDLFDDIVRAIAPRGIEGERLRKHGLRLENALRSLVAEGATGSLSGLCEKAAGRLTAQTGEALKESLDRVRAALPAESWVVDCDEALPARLLTHAWKTVGERKARGLREEIDALILKLGDILKADFARSTAGLSAEHLKASVGQALENAFDFEALSRLLARNAARDRLPEARRRRIGRALAVLQSQRFVVPGNRVLAGDDAHAFVFESCAGALEAFRQRLAELTELVKAIAVAELEIEGRYIEPHHDRFFDAFDANALAPGDLARFPDYLVCVRAGRLSGAENAALMEILSTGLPMKIMVQTDDLLPPSAFAGGHLAPAALGARLASMAIAMNDVYVLQSSASNLYPMRERILKGMGHPGPALFSVFSGAAGAAGGLPPYLVAAAAMHSRAFPAFAYDPGAGPDWASRFSLEANPQAERAWPLERFAYEDEEHQRIVEELAFTFVDFAACDARYAGHFAVVPRASWNGSMVPVGERLARARNGVPEDVPYLMMVDAGNALYRVIVDDKLVQAAARCGETWRSLQELGGIHNSHAQRLLAREREAWESERQRETKAAVAPAPAAPVPQAAAQAAAPEPVKEERPSDEPYIETPRCTTCDECTNINKRMFVYDANKQAYIADVNAGTYRQLVEAAESCQVSIIHPGKPRNPNEPGLDELIERAKPFL